MRHPSRTILALSALLLTVSPACDRSPNETDSTASNQAEQTSKRDEPVAMADIPKDQSRSGLSRGETFYVKVTPEPNPIPFQMLFELDVRVYESSEAAEPAENVQLDQVRAVMPAHDHGMKVEPVIENTGPGRFRVKGMRWHMKGPGKDGHWQLELVLNAGDQIDTATFDYQCCRPPNGE